MSLTHQQAYLPTQDPIAMLQWAEHYQALASGRPSAPPTAATRQAFVLRRGIVESVPDRGFELHDDRQGLINAEDQMLPADT